ncbi:MAG: SMP-30/gluconolactonase/LRE family protein [Acidimicrobiia bacterium]|nr:SMP-30/gluconolactonase/LRE family protein [Acidimicrobiia bacterium]
MPAASVEIVVNLHARLGEGPRWDHRKGLLAWVDILGGHVHQTDPASGFTTTIQVGPEVGALALYGDDGYLLAIRNGFATVANARVVDFQPVFNEPDVRMNDGVVDPVGRFVAGSMGRDARPETGSLYQRDRDGTVRTLFGGVTISNGLAWSASGDLMYYVDSGLQRIDLMDYDPASGEVSGRRVFVDVPDADGTPDGVAIDAEDCLWVALWGGGKVRRYSPDAEIIGEIEIPAARVSACGFGGPDLDRLFITTAAVGRGQSIDDGGLDGALFVVDPGCRGTESIVVRGTA